MGQQQLLLIVLGVIIVGIAVVVGINVFTASSSQANTDAITADLTNLGAQAQQFYRKPTALGGGGNKFTGWVIPASLLKTPNMSANVTLTPGEQEITLVGVGTEQGTIDPASKVTVTMTVTPTGLSTVITK